MKIEKGSRSWFVCRHGNLVADLYLTIRADEATEEELYKSGRMKVARKFKRWNDIHPCAKVTVEFQGVIGPNDPH